MIWRSHLGLLCESIRAIALVGVVLVIGLGPAFDAHTSHSDASPVEISIVTNAIGDWSQAGDSLSTSTTTHCGANSVCFAAVPSKAVDLLTPKFGDAYFATVLNSADPSVTFGLLRPPQQA